MVERAFGRAVGLVVIAMVVALGMAATPRGQGSWLVASDGGVFTFGDARFLGSTGGMELRRPVVGMKATRSGRGYWLASEEGSIFAYGDAEPLGSTGGNALQAPAVAIT